VLPPNMTISLIPLSPGDCKTILDPPACTSPNFLTDPLRRSERFGSQSDDLSLHRRFGRQNIQ
jgi:hypothetical protein